MHETKDVQPTAPVLERLRTLENHTGAQQTELNTLQHRIARLEARLSEILGVDCEYTPPPEVQESPRVVGLRR